MMIQSDLRTSCSGLNYVSLHSHMNMYNIIKNTYIDRGDAICEESVYYIP